MLKQDNYGWIVFGVFTLLLGVGAMLAPVGVRYLENRAKEKEQHKYRANVCIAPWHSKEGPLTFEDNNARYMKAFLSIEGSNETNELQRYSSDTDVARFSVSSYDMFRITQKYGRTQEVKGVTFALDKDGNESTRKKVKVRNGLVDFLDNQ